MKVLNKNFKNSVVDLIWLLDRGYPKKPSVRLVGDRYRLSSDERKILFRGVFATAAAQKRQKKLAALSEPPVQRLIVDGHNVFRTMQSYLDGKTIFRAMDGFLRDISGFRTTGGSIRYASRCVDLLIDFIKRQDLPRNGCFQLIVYLDYPVPQSGRLAGYLRQCLHQNNISAKVEAVHSPDSIIVDETKSLPDSVAATSDTVILDKVEKAMDIPQWIITRVFKKQLLDLGKLVQ